MTNSTLTQQAIAMQTWIVAGVDDADGVDLAARWGKEDALEGKKRSGEMFVFLSAEYHSYHEAYSRGLYIRRALHDDVSAAAIAECAWFAEISGAKPVAKVTTAADVDSEHIGLHFSTHPYRY